MASSFKKNFPRLIPALITRRLCGGGSSCACVPPTSGKCERLRKQLVSDSVLSTGTRSYQQKFEQCVESRCLGHAERPPPPHHSCQRFFSVKLDSIPECCLEAKVVDRGAVLRYAALSCRGRRVVTVEFTDHFHFPDASADRSNSASSVLSDLLLLSPSLRLKRITTRC